MAKAKKRSAAAKAKPKRTPKRRASADPLAVDLAAKAIKKLAIARGCYKGADKLLAELLARGAKHGDAFDVGGRRYRLTDNFKAAKGGKLFRTTAFVQWSLENEGEVDA